MSNFNVDAGNDPKVIISALRIGNRKSLIKDTSTGMPPSPTLPSLLVSVRSVDEAHLALSGGIEILDVKEPSRGSLGMASLDVIAGISRMNEHVSHEIPVSVALGEMNDWTMDTAIPSLPAGISFAKMGLSGCSGEPQWQSRWRRLRTTFEQQADSRFHWVAVAYADSADAKSPSVSEIMEAAIESECSGLLIDTWTKGDRTLLDSIGLSDLRSIADACHSAGLFFALAGKLNQQTLAPLSDVPVDVLAIRSAACRGCDRNVELDPKRISDFRAQIGFCFARR